LAGNRIAVPSRWLAQPWLRWLSQPTGQLSKTGFETVPLAGPVGWLIIVKFGILACFTFAQNINIFVKMPQSSAAASFYQSLKDCQLICGKDDVTELREDLVEALVHIHFDSVNLLP